MREAILLAVAATALGSAAWAQGNATAEGDDKIVCRRSADQTGTRIGRSQRVCRTRAEWRANERATENERDRLDRDNRSSSRE